MRLIPDGKATASGHSGGDLLEEILAFESPDVVTDEGARFVSAELFRELLLSDLGFSVRKGGVLRLEKIRVKGTLDLRHALVKSPLELVSCEFTAPVHLEEAHFPALTFNKCRIHKMHAEHMKVDGDVKLNRLRFNHVDLSGAQIADDLHLRGARPRGQQTGVCLNMSGMRVGGDMDCRRLKTDGRVALKGARVEGEVNLTDATIGRNDLPCDSSEDKSLDAEELTVRRGVIAHGLTVCGGSTSFIDLQCSTSLELINATLLHPRNDGVALYLDRCKVGGSVFCNEDLPSERGGGLSTRGFVQAVGVEVGGSMYFNGSSLNTDDSRDPQNALIIERSHIKGNFGTEDSVSFTSHGKVSLTNSKIDGKLILDLAKIYNPHGVAVDLLNAKVNVLKFFGTPGSGRVDLTEASLGVLLDQPELYDALNPGWIILNGMRYHTIHTSKVLPEQRLKWLRQGTSTIRLKDGYGPPSAGIVPQPWEQLAATYKQVGLTSEAHFILLKKNQELNRKSTIWKKAWNYSQDWTYGYGHKPRRIIPWILSLLFIGTLVFNHPEYNSVRNGGGWGNALLYSLHLLLPTVEVGSGNIPTQPQGVFIALLLTIMGWLFGIIAIACINRVMKE